MAAHPDQAIAPEIVMDNDAGSLIKREACGVIPWKPKLLAYGTSADTFGDTYPVVGYASLRYDE